MTILPHPRDGKCFDAPPGSTGGGKINVHNLTTKRSRAVEEPSLVELREGLNDHGQARNGFHLEILREWGKRG
jgi:hypothetical protein